MMKWHKAILVVGLLCAVAVLLLITRGETGAEGIAQPPIVHAPAAHHAQATSVHGAIALSAASQRVPVGGGASDAVPPSAFAPPVFRALPDGLNGRQLRDIHDTLSNSAQSGDAKAASTLGALVDECKQGLKDIAQLAEKTFTAYHPDPVVNKLLQERYAVVGKQCAQLNATELAAADDWMLLAAKGGDRAALLRLAYFAPDTLDPDHDAKSSAWRETLQAGLDKLAQAGDAEAATMLAKYFLAARGIDNLKAAYSYFDLASKAAATTGEAEYATKMRDHVASEIAKEEQHGS